jgi:hypothetical protein
MVGTCRLCERRALLQSSHILPKWAFRRVRSRGTGAPPILVENGTRRYTDKQDTERLLCTACEQRFCRWEDRVSRLAVQDDGSSPALRAITMRARMMPGMESEADGSVLGDQLALFAASVVWRAGASSRKDVTFRGYAEEFKSFVFGGPARLDHARLIVHIIDPEGHPVAAEVATYPATFPGDTYHEHQFAVPGLNFTFFEGNALPARYDDCCFLRTKRVWVIDGDQMGRHVLQKYQIATPVGKRWLAAPGVRTAPTT